MKYEVYKEQKSAMSDRSPQKLPRHQPRVTIEQQRDCSFSEAVRVVDGRALNCARTWRYRLMTSGSEE